MYRLGKERYFLIPAPDLTYLKDTHTFGGGGSRLNAGPMSSNNIPLNEIPESRLILRPLLASLRTAARNNRIPTSVALVLLTEL